MEAMDRQEMFNG